MLWWTVRKLKKSRDPKTRRSAALQLGQSGDARAAGPLIAALEDPERDVRTAVLEALGNFRDPRTVDAVVSALKGSHAVTAAEVLGKIGDPRAMEALAAALNHPAFGVSQAAGKALEALGNFRDPRTVDAVLSAFQEEQTVTAAEVLGKIGDPRAIEPLATALNHRDTRVRQAAGKALEKLGWRPTNAVHRAQYAVARGNFDQAVAEGAHAVEPLVAVLLYSPYAQQAAAHALGRIGDSRAVAPLIAALKNREPEERAAAATALGRIRDAQAVEPLAWAFYDSDMRVREAAEAALGEIKDERAIEPLVRMLTTSLKSQNWDVANRAAHVLGELGDARAVDPLLDALKYGGGAVVGSVAEALGKIGDPRAVQPLLAALGGGYMMGDPAAEALARIGPAAVAPLVEVLRSQHSPSSRIYAAEVLGRSRDACAVDPLLVTLGDQNADVRAAAAKALQALRWVEQTFGQHGLLAIASGEYDEAVAGQAADATSLASMLSDKTASTYIRWIAGAALMHSDNRAVQPNFLDLWADLFDCYGAGVPTFFRESWQSFTPRPGGDLVTLADEVLSYRVRDATPAGHKYGSTTASLEEGTAAIHGLCRIDNPFTTRILRLVAEKKDIKVSVSSCGSAVECSLDFGEQRQIAREELVRRRMV